MHSRNKSISLILLIVLLTGCGRADSVRPAVDISGQTPDAPPSEEAAEEPETRPPLGERAFMLDFLL